ncbi:MAG: diguanylate cyclase (GGDEF)-like protein [Halioglobus sp.]|jgi:diguanylate cyclase (GGDEF)-like protein
MEELLPQSWVYIHFSLILIITCAQMLVIYILGDSSNPPAGLGMFTVYFMGALLGWIAFTLQQVSEKIMTVDVPSVAVIISSYILYLAAGRRAQITRGRLTLGVVCLLATLCSLVLPKSQMFVIQVSTTALFFIAAGLVCAWRSLNHKNIGDGIISFAALIMCITAPLVLYYQLVLGKEVVAQALAIGGYSVAYVLVAIGFLASVLIEYQGHIARLSTHDPLSRVYNRRGMDEALQLSLAAALRRNLPTSAIMVDIDHFDQINNSFGLETGDHVIRTIAALLAKMSRATDVVARVSGKKFMLVLPETELKHAKTLADRIRLAIGERPLLVHEQRITVTASVGVTASKGDVDLDELSAAANQAMNLARQNGRNQVASIDRDPIHLTTDPASL